MHLTSFVLVMGLVLAVAAEAADPSLVGWWKLDDGSGDTAVDSSDYGNNGTLNGGPQWVPGRLGGALQLDGVDDFVVVPNAESLTADNEVTVMLWWNAEVAGNGAGGAYGGLVTKGTGSIRAYSLYCNIDNVFHFSTGAPGDWANSWSTGTFVLNEWTHVTAQVVDGRHQYWINGQDAGTEDFGTIILPGASSTEPVYIGRATEGTYSQGMIDDARIYNRALSQQEILQAMTGAPIAGNPSPSNDATDVLRDVTLSWTPGEFAALHDVYVGDSFEDVNTATVPTDPGLDVNSLDLGRLEFGKTVYWRVDEVNAAPDNTVFTGDVWSFTVEPVGYPITGSRITAHASSQNSADEGPDKTIDGSGVLGEDHSTDNIDMWRSDTSEPNQAWIQYDFDKVYKLAELKVWNHNSGLEMDAGFGIKEAVIEVSVDGTEFTPIKTVELAQAAQSSIDILGVVAKSLRITAQSNWGGIFQKYGLSEVEILAVPLAARELTPADEATDISPVATTLAWLAGREADSHDVYISTDVDDVINGTATPVSSSDASINIDLDVDQTYYWCVDEVNNLMDPAVWAGDIQSFSTGAYVSVDDMESYSNEEDSRIFNAWVDGYDNSSQNGALVGADPMANDYSPESGTVNTGSQSLPIHYNNSAGALYSEATRTFEGSQDWTKHGVQELHVYFHGSVDNAAGQLYVKINDTKVLYEGYGDTLQVSKWIPFVIDLSSVEGLQSVTSLAIRIEGGGSGVLYIDDIQLCPKVAQSAIFSENFDGIAGANFNGGQLQSDLDLAWGADLPGWSKAGDGAVHIVDHANVTGNIVNPRNFAPMLWGAMPNQTLENANIITLDIPISGSNAAGQVYQVSFLASPSVYSAGAQASQATEGVLIEVLRIDDTVLASHASLPGAWAGDMAFVADSFEYTGDGSGGIRFRISPSNPNVGRFGAAIDDLTLNPAPPVFSENFDGIAGGNFNGGQLQSDLDLAWGADLPGWSKAGDGAVHIVDHANVTGNIVNPRNFAPMLWGAMPNQTLENANIITLDIPISGSNAAGQVYQVSFLASPSVYSAGAQASQATEGVLIEVLRIDDTVLASHASLPGAWAGDMAFVADSFEYTGDGSGGIRFRISPSNPNVGRFGAAIDDLTLNTVAPGQ